MKKIFFIFILSIACHLLPDSIELKQIFFNKAPVLQKNECFDNALELFNDLCAQEPTNPLYHFNRASALLSLGHLEEAIESYKQVYDLAPDMLAALYNVGYVLKTNGQLDKAIKVFKHVLEINPTYEPAHLALGFSYIMQGNFKLGWAQHEYYLKRASKNADTLRELIKNNAVAGKTIILLYEGGLGDTLQFIRYAQRLHNMGAQIIAGVQKPLIPLLSLCPYIDQLIAENDPLPSCHAYSSLLSLPAVFNDDETTFPKIVPYVHIEQAIIDSWQPTFDSTYFNIGIFWQANMQNDESRLPIARRGIPLLELLPLNDIPGVRFYSLQQEDGLEQLTELPSDFKIQVFDTDFDKTHESFIDSGAVMHHLDLIITVDSAIAHLAGALNRPVWLLLPFSTDWRWIYGRTDSPWYPSMRIFKQPTPFNWHSVIEQVKQSLEELINKKI